MMPPRRAHGILAHYFRGPTDPVDPTALTAEQWEAGLRAYGARLVSAEDWLRALRRRRLRDAVCVTLDDGLACQRIALRVLRRMGITPFLYVITETLAGQRNEVEDHRWIRNLYGSFPAFYEAWRPCVLTRLARTRPMPSDYLASYGYLTEPERRYRWWRNEASSPEERTMIMQELRGLRGMDVPPWHWFTRTDLQQLTTQVVLGSHTHTHPWAMHRLTPVEQFGEYQTARLILQTIYDDVPATTISHPNGISTREGRQFLKQSGIELGWASRMTTGASPLMMPRYSVGDWRR